MAPSLFSNKQSPEHALQDKPLRATLSVHTMHDDLESIEGRGKGPSHAQEQTEQQEFVDIPSDSAASQPPINPFSEEGEKISQSQKKSVPYQSKSPFGVVPENTEKASPQPDFSQQPAGENGLRPLTRQGKLLRDQPIIGKKFLLMGGVGVVAALFVLAGIWYLFFGNEEGTLEPGPSSDIIEGTPEISENVTPKEYPFALDKPNYLSLNTETISSQGILTTFSQAADRIKEAGISVPIEFLITDQNNNPLAFSRFAFLLQLDLDPDLLALVDEPFSLYEYNDEGSIRLGLVLTLNDTSAASAQIEKTESQLPYAFRALILEPDVSVGKNLPFRSTNYNQFSIRFANIDSNQNISLDYVLNNSQLLMGMSKNTLRAILDVSAQ